MGTAEVAQTCDHLVDRHLRLPLGGTELGDEKGAEALLEHIQASGARFEAALVPAGLDRRDEALRALEAWEVRPWTLWPYYAVFLRYLFQDTWARLHGDPRWRDLWERIDAALGVGAGDGDGSPP